MRDGGGSELCRFCQVQSGIVKRQLGVNVSPSFDLITAWKLFENTAFARVDK